jgi:cytochrome c
VHSRLPARITAAITVITALAAFTAVVMSSDSANATPSKQVDCSACHGTGGYAGTVTAVPNTEYPATGGAYTVAVGVSQNAAGLAGYWVANSTVAGATGTTTGVYGGEDGLNAWSVAMTAPATEGVYYYKVFGEDGPKGTSGQTNYAAYSVTVDKTAPVTTDNHDTAKHASFKLVLTPTDVVSGVAITQYSVDGGVWTTGTSVTVSLPKRHKRAGTTAGTHTIQYRSTDKAGNVESVKSCQVVLG